MPKKTLDVADYTYRGREDRYGSICKVIDRVRDEDVLGDVGPCFVVEFRDGVTRLVPAVDLTPWFPI